MNSCFICHHHRTHTHNNNNNTRKSHFLLNYNSYEMKRRWSVLCIKKIRKEEKKMRITPNLTHIFIHSCYVPYSSQYFYSECGAELLNIFVYHTVYVSPIFNNEEYVAHPPFILFLVVVVICYFKLLSCKSNPNHAESMPSYTVFWRRKNKQIDIYLKIFGKKNIFLFFVCFFICYFFYLF